MTTLAQVAQFRSAQSRVIDMATGDLTRAFRSLDLGRPQVARDALLEAYPAVSAQYGDVASTISAEWYEDLRRSELGGTFNARLAELPSDERAVRNVRWAAGDLWSENPEKVLNLLTGSLERMLADAARETTAENTKRDSSAAGWQRLHQPGACRFCQMLHQRGGVYKRKTADFASHDNCRCTIAPSWDADAPEVDVRAYEASESLVSLQRRASNPDLSAKDRAKAQRTLDRHRARTREWLATGRLEEINALMQ